MLRQPLEDGSVTISRSAGKITLPSSVMLVAAMNPCPCGYTGDPSRECRCTVPQIQRYRSKISGPLLDRIDIHIEAQLKSDLLNEIAGIRFGENGYFFVNNYSGKVLAHGEEPEMVGTSIWDYGDSRGTLVFHELRKAVENPEGGFCHYWWRMPETGIERPKIAFAKVIPDWEWLIGTGLYVDKISFKDLHK